MIGEKGDSEQMLGFLRDTLRFDALVTGDCRTANSVRSTIKTVLQNEVV
jgi:hypothetical protein